MLQLSTFDLNLLRTLDVLLRERSVTRSAAALNVTQQAVSGSLKRLRAHFDDPLLVRNGQRLEPTPLALALLPHIRDVVRQIASALQVTPAFSPQTAKRRFRIAMSEHVSLTLLPQVLAELARSAPELTFEIVPVNRRAVYELDLGDLDFLIMPKGHSNRLHLARAISSLPLFQDHFVCVVDANNGNVDERLSIDAYAGMRHVSLGAEDGFRSLVEAAWLRAGLSPSVSVTASSFVEIITLVRSTKLIATVHSRLARMVQPMSSIRIVACPIPIDQVSQQISWHARNDEDLIHHFVKDAFLSKAEREMAPDE